MAKGERTHGDTGAVTARRLHKRLRRAEAELDTALKKRDRAQARVEALGIIADEIRATLAERARADAAAVDQADAAAGLERADAASDDTANDDTASDDAVRGTRADSGTLPSGAGDPVVATTTAGAAAPPRERRPGPARRR
jgi:hypothetical protein